MASTRLNNNYNTQENGNPTTKIKFLSQEERSLIKAIHNGDIKLASRLITEDGLDVNIQDVLLRTPLLRTCYLRSSDTRCTLAKILIKNGADVNIVDKHRRSALMTACMESDEEDLVRLMLTTAKDIDVNIRDENGDTALMHAVRTDNVESIRALVTWKPSAWKSGEVLVDLGNYEGMYPLLLAAKQQNPDICEILVRDGNAKYDEIPTSCKRYLPAECRGGGDGIAISHSSPFEKYRHSAQDIPKTPYRPPMILDIDPESDDESLGAGDEDDVEPTMSTSPLPPARPPPSPLFRSVSPWMTAMAATRLKKRGKTFVMKSQQRKSPENDEGHSVIPSRNGSSTPELPVKNVKSPRKSQSPVDERHNSRPTFTPEKRNKCPPSPDKSPVSKNVEKDPEKTQKKSTEPPKRQIETDKSTSNGNNDPKEPQKQQQPRSPQKDNKEGAKQKETKAESKPETTPPKSQPEKQIKKQKSPKREVKTEPENSSKDKESSTLKGDEPTANQPRAESPKPKQKGGWVESSPSTDPEPMSDYNRPTKKKPAYKTKGGRVIHPNAKKDPLFQKIKEAKASGKSISEVTATKRPSGAGQQSRKPSNRRVLVQ